MKSAGSTLSTDQNTVPIVSPSSPIDTPMENDEIQREEATTINEIESQEGVTFKQLEAITGASVDKIRRTAKKVEGLVGSSIRLGEAKIGQEVRLTDEGALLVIEYLQNPDEFQSKYCVALASASEGSEVSAVENRAIAATETAVAIDAISDRLAKKAASKAALRLAQTQTEQELETYFLEEMEREQENRECESRLAQAAALLGRVQERKLDRISATRESRQINIDSVNSALGKLGFSVSLPWK